MIAKGKEATAFRHALTDFFNSLIKATAASSLLYDEPVLMENIVSWIGAMSSAANRPFRHTATVASLAITSALCDLARETAEATAKTIRQSESEKKQKRVNKGRVADLDAKIKKAGQRQEALENIIEDWFDTVFVHRYRDVDPRIRVDCMQALSYWIMTYPDLFFDANYLKYLGWVLSDTNAHTRLEVVKQLQKLYKDKDKLVGLKTFTERFRARMVEMATRDADAHVRAVAVELLDTLREAGLLEPDDIDSVGRLIFDSEPRVRKAVVGFFVESINEVYESKIEELGGQEALDEALVTVEGDDDFDSPRLEWLKMKCVVEALQNYDSEDQALPSQLERGPGGVGYILVASGVESRFSLAAQALYDKMPEVKEWEVLAGYLLFDHSQTAQNGTTDDPEILFKQECRLTEKDEILLLEVLNAAVKLKLTEATTTDHRSKKTKQQKQELQDVQEEAARHLAVLIPRLLNKFGAIPEAASAVLRLEHVLNLEVFQEIRQVSTTYSALLDDINKQFLTHGDESVLVEASAALLHAKSYEDLGEVTEGKLQALWEDVTNTLHALSRGKDLTIRGNLSTNLLTGLANTVRRIANLASVSDCTEPLSTAPSTTSKNASQSPHPPNAIRALIATVSRGIPGPDIDADTNALEDVLATHAARAALFYFMWTVRSWTSLITSGTPVPDAELDALAAQRDAAVAALTAVLRARKGADELRLAVAGVLLDLHTLFATLRQARPASTRPGVEWHEDYLALALELDPRAQRLLVACLAAAEKAFARRAKRTLEVGDDEEEEREGEEEEPESEDEDEVGEEAEAERQTAALVAEQRLCELASKLVLGIIAGVVDAAPEGAGGGAQADRVQGSPALGPIGLRLERNRTRLGHNYKEVVAFLEKGEKGSSAKGRGGGRQQKGKGAADGTPRAAAGTPGRARGRTGAQAKSRELVETDDEIEDDEGEERDERRVHDEEGDEEALRRRGLLEEDVDHGLEEADAGAGAGEEEVESVLGD